MTPNFLERKPILPNALYTSDEYAVVTDESTRTRLAGDFVYLQIDSDDLTADRKFSVDACTISSETGSDAYVLFDATSCSNGFVDLFVSYAGNVVRLQHRLFQFGGTQRSSYRKLVAKKASLVYPDTLLNSRFKLSVLITL